MYITTPAPSTGPRIVPAPPIRTMTKACTDVPMPASPGDTKRWEYAESAPATPAIIPATTNAESLSRAVSYPRARMRRSFSRTPVSARP